MFWDKFLEKTVVPFDTKNLFQVSYEPDRNIFAVERRGFTFNDANTEEIIWIKNNVKEIAQVIFESESFEREMTAESHRVNLLTFSDWPTLRHREEVDLGIPTTLSEQEFLDLLRYRQALRDMVGINNEDGSPKLKSDITNWPTPPEWLPDWAK